MTNAFSKRLVNHVYALSIYFMHYNFVRIHQTTRVTPAMAANVTGKLWSLEDIVRVVDDWQRALIRIVLSYRDRIAHGSWRPRPPYKGRDK